MAHHEISIYDLATGMFAGVYGGATQALLELQVGAGQGFVAGAYERSTWYVVDGTPTPRPHHGLDPVALTVPAGQSVRIEGLRPGSVVRGPFGEVVVDDGYIEWACAESGSYALHISHWPCCEEILYATFT